MEYKLVSAIQPNKCFGSFRQEISKKNDGERLHLGDLYGKIASIEEKLLKSGDYSKCATGDFIAEPSDEAEYAIRSGVLWLPSWILGLFTVALDGKNISGDGLKVVAFAFHVYVVKDSNSSNMFRYEFVPFVDSRETDPLADLIEQVSSVKRLPPSRETKVVEQAAKSKKTS